MITIEELTKTYQQTILKIMLKAILMIKIPLAPQGLFAFLRGDKANDTPKNSEFYTYSLYSVFVNFSVLQLESIFKLLLQNGMVLFNEDGNISVTPLGTSFLNGDLDVEISFLCLL